MLSEAKHQVASIERRGARFSNRTNPSLRMTTPMLRHLAIQESINKQIKHQPQLTGHSTES